MLDLLGSFIVIIIIITVLCNNLKKKQGTKDLCLIYMTIKLPFLMILCVK